MTDKIKEAREWLNAHYCQSECAHYKTILKALSTYEKLQGVDLDALAKIYEEERQKYNCRRIYYKNNQAAFKGAMEKAIAQLVADIGKDG